MYKNTCFYPLLPALFSISCHEKLAFKTFLMIEFYGEKPVGMERH